MSDGFVLYNWLRDCILGITYKPGTSTLRRSVALDTINTLNNLGADVKAHDPQADLSELEQSSEFEFFEDIFQALYQSDAIAVMTGWEQYKEIDWIEAKKMVSNPLLIDCNNMFDSSKLEECGYQYFGIGRGLKQRDS